MEQPAFTLPTAFALGWLAREQELLAFDSSAARDFAAKHSARHSTADYNLSVFFQGLAAVRGTFIRKTLGIEQ